ncbi:hypothetical protein [Spirilliplanes yamanashiensis]|uniref:Uncharacterized protein n=1 Tax=Spirilliplanes yamanashiensis TaxID=42233 RepID=A0A8J3YAK4_9ACTN|nr:hypothetical protein [Spirilliplanes yamanashiensis]MDP9816047.1 hypothetical protein [Spirilliplanes yamanashiensis]GIJ04307.1 hypothetical protein Sya03_36590 [Spirilliplanes yamanashiensis]
MILADRLARARTVATRAALIPLLVRAAVFLCGLLAAVVAYPGSLVSSRLLALLAVVALWPAVAPRGRGATAAVLAVLAGWILDTTWYDAPIELWRVLAIASLTYLLHSFAALAAALPYDATVELDVVTLWAGRAAGVALASAVLTVIVLSVADIGGGVHLAATLAGIAVAVAAAALLAWLLRRP